jgi:thiol:disulfide interchange protein
VAAGGTRGDAGSRLAASRSAGLIPWVVFDRAKAESLTAGGQLVFVDVTADWCFTCKVNERLILDTPEVAKAFTENGVVPMRADWTNKSDEIADFLKEHGRYGIPFYILYRPGREPHVFSELPNKDGLVATVREAAAVLRPVAQR